MSVDAGLLARVRTRLAGDGGTPTASRVAVALREEGGRCAAMPSCSEC